MILTLPFLYLVLCFFFEQIWFDTWWLVWLTVVGGAYDLLEKLIDRIGSKKISILNTMIVYWRKDKREFAKYYVDALLSYKHNIEV